MTEIIFYEELKKINIDLTNKQKQQFRDYLNYLIDYNKIINLTAITEKNEIYLKHFYDSLLVAKYYSFSNEKVLDIGSGPGFPGVPLLICFPDIQLTIIESNTKKVVFLNNLKEILGLNFEIVNERAEIHAKKVREIFDVVVSRAVANLSILAELSIPFLKNGGILISYKSKAEDEILNIDKCLKKLSSILQKVEKTFLIDDIVRTFIFIKKTGPTDLKYPREYKKIKKNPL